MEMLKKTSDYEIIGHWLVVKQDENTVVVAKLGVISGFEVKNDMAFTNNKAIFMNKCAEVSFDVEKTNKDALFYIFQIKNEDEYNGIKKILGVME